ncbi:MAG TPA: hypothetical protein VGC97_05100 [Pyrinomonadaceae bacterium]
MKKNFYLLGLFVLCLFMADGVHGQATPDSQKELNDLRQKSYQMRAVKSYRRTMTTEVLDEKGATLKPKTTTVGESVPPDRHRYTTTFIKDGAPQKRETIFIGKNIYVRENGGAWKLEESKQTESLAISVSSAVILVEETTLNGQPVRVYEEKGNSYSNGDFVSKYWFTTEGELLKSEVESRKPNETSRTVTIYEYDANIKIEAPIK